MIKYKMQFENLNTRDAAINLFHELGYHSYEDGISKNQLCVLTHENGVVRTTENLLGCGTFLQIYIDQLHDLAVLHRNDVCDANYSIAVASDRPDTPVFKTSEGRFYTFSTTNNKWVECKSINDKTTGLKALAIRQTALDTEPTTIKVKGFEGLIEGRDALSAALNGEIVQITLEPWEEKHWNDFNPLKDEVSTKVFFTGLSDRQKVFFRIKPKTISINGIEVPAPNFHKPSDGYSVWWLDDSARFKRGYHGSENFIGDDDDSWAFGWWDSKHKIEQVVEALRKVFEVQS